MKKTFTQEGLIHPIAWWGGEGNHLVEKKQPNEEGRVLGV